MKNIQTIDIVFNKFPMEEKMNDIICFDEKVNPVELFTSEKVDELLKKIKERARSFEGDISTEKGRKAIASFAREIASTKVALDDAGKSLVSDWKKQSAAVDAERKKIRDTLDVLKEEIRKPLTDWEEVEKKRVFDRENRLNEIANLQNFLVQNPDINQIDAAVLRLNELTIFDWQEFSVRAEKIIESVSQKLSEQRKFRDNYDAEQVEINRLREEKAAREKAEHEAKIAAEAARLAKEEADKEIFEAERKVEAERRAKEEAERRAKEAEEEKKELERRAEIEKKYAVEAAVKMERERIQAEEKAKAEEVDKIEKDQEHKAKIHNKVLSAIQTIIDEGGENIGKKIVSHIAKGNVPHVKIQY